jgi:hypothetical protein
MAVTQLLPLLSTYLCEASFSAMSVLKTKLRNRLSPGNYLIMAPSNVKTGSENMISSKEAHISHEITSS